MLKLLLSPSDSMSIFVRWCLPSKGVFLQFSEMLSAFWIAWVQQDLTMLTLMTFSLKEWSILITWIKNYSIKIWMCFIPSAEILAFILWWSVSKVTCRKYSYFFFPFSFFIPLPSLLQNVGEFWCTPMFPHQTISGWDYIEPEPNVTKSVEKFQWFQWCLSEAAIHEDTLLNLKEELPYRSCLEHLK